MEAEFLNKIKEIDLGAHWNNPETARLPRQRED
jgi:hypothetical protein